MQELKKKPNIVIFNLLMSTAQHYITNNFLTFNNILIIYFCYIWLHIKCNTIDGTKSYYANKLHFCLVTERNFITQNMIEEKKMKIS